MNPTFSHPGQPEMQAEVILASLQFDCLEEKPLYTIRLRYPRIIHGEVKTHRAHSQDSIADGFTFSGDIMGFTEFSRNARSSRAVPVKTMLKEVLSVPFVPWHWGKNQKGMQADEECNTIVYDKSDLNNLGMAYPRSREEAWKDASCEACDTAEAFMDAGYHKQIVNRLIEPFTWIDTLITTNRLDNFLWLRDHEDAEPHIADLARLVKQAIDAAVPQALKPGEWHLPYIDGEDREGAYLRFGETEQGYKLGIAWLRKIDSARCARISYKPFDGDASYERELDRYDSLISSSRIHSSPMEHQASPDERIFAGPDGDTPTWKNPELHGNLPGWIQHRQLIPNSNYEGA
jgi:hypothetical protein